MAELLLSCQELSKAFGAAPLFEGLSFGIFEGDHIGIVGPNGSDMSRLELGDGVCAHGRNTRGRPARRDPAR